MRTAKTLIRQGALVVMLVCHEVANLVLKPTDIKLMTE